MCRVKYTGYTISSMRRGQLGDAGPQANWLPQVKGRVERLVKRHLHRHQREPLCRALKLSTETPSERIAAELERRRDLAAVVRLPELDRETIVSFFRDVAEDEPFSEEACARIHQNDSGCILSPFCSRSVTFACTILLKCCDQTVKLRANSSDSRLERPQGPTALPHKLQAAREQQKHAQDAAYQHLVCVFLAYTDDKACSTW